MKKDVIFQNSDLSNIDKVLAMARTGKRVYKYDSLKTSRYYQVESIDAIIRGLKKEPIALIENATGTGKSYVMAITLTSLLSENIEAKALVLAHNDDLLKGFRKEFSPENSELYPIDRDGYADISRIHTMTIQSLLSLKIRNKYAYNRLVKQYTYLGIDEVHHFPCEGAEWSGVIEDFKNAGVEIIGMTATAFRTDKNYILTKYHDDFVVYRYTIEQGVKDGYLSEVYAAVVSTNVKPIKEGWEKHDLALTFTDAGYESRFGTMEKYLLKVASFWQRKPQTIVFVRRKKEAYRLKEYFDKTGSVGTVTVVTGETNSSYREEMVYEKFRNGEINVIINVKVVTEGVDLPNCEVVVIARPTKSVGLYRQMIGRGTRIPTLGSQKEFLLVIDFVDSISQNYLREVVSCGKLIDGKPLFISGPIFTQTGNTDGRIVHDTCAVFELHTRGNMEVKNRVKEIFREECEKRGIDDGRKAKALVCNPKTLALLDARLRNEGLQTLSSLVS